MATGSMTSSTTTPLVAQRKRTGPLERGTNPASAPSSGVHAHISSPSSTRHGSAPLKNKITFYTKVTPINMLAQITTASGGLERVNIVDLLFSLAHLWEQDPRVPKYLNALKDAHKKSVRAGLPFSDDLLTAIGSSSLLKANSFPKDCATWDGKEPAEQTLKDLEDFDKQTVE